MVGQARLGAFQNAGLDPRDNLSPAQPVVGQIIVHAKLPGKVCATGIGVQPGQFVTIGNKLIRIGKEALYHHVIGIERIELDDLPLVEFGVILHRPDLAAAQRYHCRLHRAVAV